MFSAYKEKVFRGVCYLFIFLLVYIIPFTHDSVLGIQKVHNCCTCYLHAINALKHIYRYRVSFDDIFLKLLKHDSHLNTVYKFTS
jgi:hypothetical protein